MKSELFMKGKLCIAVILLATVMTACDENNTPVDIQINSANTMTQIPTQTPQQAEEPEPTTDDIIRPTPAPTTGEVTISFDYIGQSGWASNQFAVWIEDMNGNYIRTLYSTRWTAAGGFRTRPMSIPTWVERSRLANMQPLEVDAIAGATPQSGILKYTWDLTDTSGNVVPPGKYQFMIEGSLRWGNRVLHSGIIDISSGRAYAQTEAKFIFDASDEHAALDMNSPETNMITSVNAVFVPCNSALSEIEQSPKIALTFDDGPSAYTDSIIDLLEQYGGRSTFFVSTSRMLERPDTVMRAFNMGNEIANHSLTHSDFSTLTEEEIKHEIQRASAAIVSVTGHSPPMHRPPFGITDRRVIDISAELGYAIIKWTVDPIDWRYRDADIVYESIMSQVERGSIILTHDTRPTTAEAMKRVIPRLIEEGYQLVTVSELLNYLYSELEPGRIYGSYTTLD